MPWSLPDPTNLSEEYPDSTVCVGLSPSPHDGRCSFLSRLEIGEGAERMMSIRKSFSSQASPDYYWRFFFFFFFLCSLLDCRGGIYSEPVSEAHEHPSIEFRAKAKGGQWSVVTESSADVWSPPEVLVPSQRPPSNRNDPARRSNNQYTCTG